MAMATLEKSVHRERLKTELRANFAILATYLFIEIARVRRTASQNAP
jgi:flagellar biosynthesis regulator FlaF